MKLFLVNILLALIWVALTARFTVENIILGYFLAFIVIGLTSKIWHNQDYANKNWLIVKFLLFLVWELIVSNFKVASDVLRFRLKNQPGVIAIPLDVNTDLEITLVANIISLTPGTLSLDVSDDRKFLFVHTLFASDIDKQKKMLKEAIEEKLHRILI